MDTCFSTMYGVYLEIKSHYVDKEWVLSLFST